MLLSSFWQIFTLDVSAEFNKKEVRIGKLFVKAHQTAGVATKQNHLYRSLDQPCSSGYWLFFFYFFFFRYIHHSFTFVLISGMWEGRALKIGNWQHLVLDMCGWELEGYQRVVFFFLWVGNNRFVIQVSDSRTGKETKCSYLCLKVIRELT